MTSFDTNKWYYIQRQEETGTGGMKSTVPFGAQNKGTVFFAERVDSDENLHRWQIIQSAAQEGYYILRTKGTGATGYLAVGSHPDGVDPSNILPIMLMQANVKDNEIYWKIESWGDDSYYLTNMANSTRNLVDVSPGVIAIQPPNSTAANQKLVFVEATAINEKAFSSIVIQSSTYPISATSTVGSSPTSASATDSNGSSPTATNTNNFPTQTANPTPETSSKGLSTNRVIAISASLGGIIVILIIALLFFVRRRRRDQHRHHAPPMYSSGQPFPYMLSSEPQPHYPHATTTTLKGGGGEGGGPQAHTDIQELYTAPTELMTTHDIPLELSGASPMRGPINPRPVDR